MAQRIINIGTSANKGNGDPIRTAFDKVNKNFTEVYSKIVAIENGTLNVVVSDINGSVHADDSTLMIDGVSAQIVGPVNNSSVTTTTLVATSIVGDLTGDVTGDVTGTVTGSLLGNSTGYHTGDLTGSVFADDSTLLVDAVNAIIPASVVSGTLSNNTTGTHTGLVIGDVTGSVFADDSTLLVDSVNAIIPGYIKLSVLKTEVAASADFADFQTRIAAL